MELASTLPTVVDHETPFDAPRVEALVAAAFGPGRFGKTAERLREGSRPEPTLSFVARKGRGLVGTVRLWPVTIGEEPGWFLGPIAVDPDVRGEGLGAALVEAALAGARESGRRTVLLVGDLAFFGRFGFERAAGAALPGPADPRRVLVWTADGGPAPTGRAMRG